MKKQWMLIPLVAAGALGSWLLLHGDDSRAQGPAAGAPPEVTVAEAPDGSQASRPTTAAESSASLSEARERACPVVTL